MEINKSKYLNIKKRNWYDEVSDISIKMNEPLGKWLTMFKGWKQEDIVSVVRSAEALSRQEKMEFSKALNWHLKKINE